MFWLLQKTATCVSLWLEVGIVLLGYSSGKDAIDHFVRNSCKRGQRWAMDTARSSVKSLTTIVVFSEIVPTDEQIMIRVQFPEFTIDNVEMFIWKIIMNAIDIFLLFDPIESLEQRSCTYSFVSLITKSPNRATRSDTSSSSQLMIAFFPESDSYPLR